ncbi:MAG: aspartate dehydrogenase [Hyphomicrobiales bacterium]|nr:aspartate dehydrogenase [Hyphomicrobiales bacterium]
MTRPALMRLGVVGFGSVARQALDAMAASGAPALDALICLSRNGARDRALDALAVYRGRLAREVMVVESVVDLIAARPGLVAEAAGHSAVQEAGAAVLGAGIDLLVTSAGALADAALRAHLDAAAACGGARWDLCSGAVGGLDILAAAKLSGLEEVTYSSRKPPRAWKGTPAERLLDLDALTAPVTFYEGAADAAARDYPQNANVAATIALTGAGFARTRVRLIADPGAERNVHEISIRSGCADIRIEIAGKPSPDNPKSSLTTGFALAANLLSRMRA